MFCLHHHFQNYGRRLVAFNPKYDLLEHNCQDFCIELAEFLDPESVRSFPLNISRGTRLLTSPKGPLL